MVLNGLQLDVQAFAGKHDRGAPHCQLADMARDQPAADHDALHSFPALNAQEPAHHRRQLAGELLDGGMDQAGSHGIGPCQHLVELGLGNLAGGRIAKRVFALAFDPLAPVVENRPEGAATGPIANKAFFVAQLFIVSFDGYGRQHEAAMAEHRSDGGL